MPRIVVGQPFFFIYIFFFFLLNAIIRIGAHMHSSSHEKKLLVSLHGPSQGPHLTQQSLHVNGRITRTNIISKRTPCTVTHVCDCSSGARRTCCTGETICVSAEQRVTSRVLFHPFPAGRSSRRKCRCREADNNLRRDSLS